MHYSIKYPKCLHILTNTCLLLAILSLECTINVTTHKPNHTSSFASKHIHLNTDSCFSNRIAGLKSSASKAHLFRHHAVHILHHRQTTATVSSSPRQADSAGTAAGTYWRLWSEVQLSQPGEQCLPGRLYPNDLQTHPISTQHLTYIVITGEHRLTTLSQSRSPSSPSYLADDCHFWRPSALTPLIQFSDVCCSTYTEHLRRSAFCWWVWNSLPAKLRQCDSLGQFKRRLKTYLFGIWDHGALWLLVRQRRIEIPLLTYWLTSYQCILCIVLYIVSHI